MKYKGPLLKNALHRAEEREKRDSRFDRHGTLISSGLKFHVSFKDELTSNKNELADVIMVESYKEFNLE